MRIAASALSTRLLLGADGCATPKPEEITVVAASRGTISTWNEVMPGDSLIKDSQVFVSLTPITGPDPGLLGILIERTRVADAMGDSGGALAVKFDRDLEEALLKEAAKRAFDELAWEFLCDRNRFAANQTTRHRYVERHLSWF